MTVFNENVLKIIQDELLIEYESVTLINVDGNAAYFILDDECYKGIARVEYTGLNIDNEMNFYFTFKEDGQKYYKGDGGMTI